MPMPYAATVVAYGPPDAVRDVVRWIDAEVEASDDERCEVRVRSESMEWLVSTMAMLAVMFDIEIAEPPEVVARIDLLTERLGRATKAKP
jgi:hypothetical protein